MIKPRSISYKGLIIFTDALIITISYLFAFWFRMYSGIFIVPATLQFTFLHCCTLAGIVLFQLYIFNQNGLYSENTFLRRIKQVPVIIKSSIVSILFVLFMSFITQGNPFLERRGVLLIAILIQIVLLMIARLIVFRALFHALLKRGIGKENVLIVGPKITSERMRNALFDFDKFRFDIKDVMTENEFDINNFSEIIIKNKVDTIFVIQENMSRDAILNIVAYCKNHMKHLFLLSNMFDVAISKIDVSTFEGIPVIDLSIPATHQIHLFFKRVFDVCVSLMLIILFSPIFFIVAAIIKFDSRGPIMFSQERIGKDGRKFKMHKFRTMHIDSDNTIHKEFVKKMIKEGTKDGSGLYKIANDPRITNIGKFLRKYSIDEFPQLENVLVGDMSLVGPRPPLEYEVENYDEWHKRRLAVRPGMTGLWQVSGRNKIGFEDMVLLDIYYAENWTIWLDLQILLKTVPVVLFKKDGT